MKTYRFVRVISVLMCIIIVTVSFPLCASSFSVPENMTLGYEKTVTLAPGITQETAVAYKQNGDRIECFAVTADLNVDTVKIETNYKDNQISTYGMQTLTEQVAAAERNHEEPYNVAASVNATFFNMSTGVPTGLFIKDGEKMSTRSPNSYSFFAIMKDGTPKIGWASQIKTYQNDMLYAVAGSPTLIMNGKINSKDGVKISNYSETLAPRTCVGITPDNKVIFLVVDGRQAPRTCGLTPYQAALMFQSFGCTSALMLDGGGSSTFASRVPGEDFTVKNTPSDGGERAIAGSMLIISQAVPTGELDHINLNCDYNHLTAGSSVNINPVALDYSEAPVPLPQSGLSWSVSDPSKGTVTQDGVFTAGENASGDVSVNISYNGQVLGSIDFSIVVPDNIMFSKKKTSAAYSSRIQLPVKATYGEYPVAINENDIIAVHEYEYNGTVHDSLLDNYGYFEGMYFNTPDESIGIKSEILYMVPYFAEDESYISTLTLEYYKDGEDYFDFENATVQSEEISYYRTISNTTTKDDYNYYITDQNRPVYGEYKFGIAMDEMKPPEDLVPLWDAFASVLGNTIWDAFLTLAGKISADTTVTIDLTLDPNFEFGSFEDLVLTNHLFTLDKDNIVVNEDRTAATFTCRWNESFVKEIMSSDEGINSDAVSSTIMVKNLYTVMKDPSLAQTPAGLKIVNQFSISYDLIAWSGSAYQIANKNEALKPYAYKRNSKTGIRFQTNYASGEETFMIFGDTSDLNGWHDSYYYVNGSVLTGVQYLPDKAGSENSFYYEFDDAGTLQGKYTGVVKSGGSVRYSQDGTAVFAGLVKDEDNNYYYIDETLEAVKDCAVLIEKTNGLVQEDTYVALEDGRIVLSSSESGLLSYADFVNPENEPVLQSEDPITTESRVGYYNGGAVEFFTVVKYGDIDSDGNSDGCDSLFVLCVINGLLSENELSPAQFRAADCNSDGQIDEEDYNLLTAAGIMTGTIDQSSAI